MARYFRDQDEIGSRISIDVPQGNSVETAAGSKINSGCERTSVERARAGKILKNRQSLAEVRAGNQFALAVAVQVAQDDITATRQSGIIDARLKGIGIDIA